MAEFENLLLRRQRILRSLVHLIIYNRTGVTLGMQFSLASQSALIYPALLSLTVSVLVCMHGARVHGARRMEGLGIRKETLTVRNAEASRGVWGMLPQKVLEFLSFIGRF